LRPCAYQIDRPNSSLRIFPNASNNPNRSTKPDDCASRYSPQSLTPTIRGPLALQALAADLMPELPEVETMCRGIAPVIGRRVVKIERPPCRRRPIVIQPRLDRFRRRAEGKSIVAIQRAGKRLVIWLDSAAMRPRDPRLTQVSANFAACHGEEAIVVEPRMTGLVLLADPPTHEHLRFRLRLSGSKRELLFWDRRGLGSVRLFSAEEFAARFVGESTTLGPDALSVSVEQLHHRLGFSRRAIKVALLDQRAIAGIGNLYASEILHTAGIHPATRCQRLRPVQWQCLHAAMLDVLNEAIRCEGSTLADGTYRNALNQSGDYQNHHRVYDRAGQICPTCARGPVRRIVQAQRSTFFCPACQMR